MSMIKKLMPYLIGALIGLGFYYMIDKYHAKDITPKVEQAAIPSELDQVPATVKITQETEPEKIYCPEPKECPPIPKCNPKIITKVRYKTLYKDRIIHVPVKLKPGCHVDWTTGDVIGKTDKRMNLTCRVDLAKRHVDTEFTESGWAKTQREAVEHLKKTRP